MSNGRLALSFDVGGTFTDFVVVDLNANSLVRRHKVLTNNARPEAGVLQGIHDLLASPDISAESIEFVVHSTTLVTNALIERKGARTALLATRGFRDVLELVREQMYDIYDIFAPHPEPLVPRPLRLEIDERIAATGEVVTAPGEKTINDAIENLRAAKVESVAISFLHAYANPDHERRLADTIRRELPDVAVSSSSFVAPFAGEYERTSTAVADAFTKPQVADYLTKLSNLLNDLDVSVPLHMMLSSGEIASAKTAVDRPVRLLESGPAAGAIAAAYFGDHADQQDVLSLDMGGTTAKACVIEGGRPEIAQSIEVARARRFMRGSGFPVVAPVVNLIEIGAGGGSIARRDELGLLKVGPDSAGADPGPACYGNGGTAPTVSDANLVLGYLNPDFFLGGSVTLREDLARAAIEELSYQLGLTVEETAWGIYRVVNENMASAARVHIIEKNRDPRSLAMIAFGGAGPAHAIAVAKVLGSPTVIFPRGAGVASAFGALVAPIAFTAGQTHITRLDGANWDTIETIYQDLQNEVLSELETAGVTAEDVSFTRSAEMRIAGQYHEITVEIPEEPLTDSHRETIEDAFRAAYADRYGRVLEGMPIETLQWQLTGEKITSPVTLDEQDEGTVDAAAAIKSHRSAYFPDRGFSEVPIYDREKLQPGMEFTGPAIVEETEATLVIWPGDAVKVDRYQALIVSITSNNEQD